MTHHSYIKLYPVQSLDPCDPYTYGCLNTPYGKIMLIGRSGFLIALGLTDCLSDLQKSTWPKAPWVERDEFAVLTWQQITHKIPVKAVLLGTPFQISVWHELLGLSKGEVISYLDLANRVQKPTAVRAVASAVGANPISILIPCHQIIRSDGGLGGYRWGVGIKKALLSKGE